MSNSLILEAITRCIRDLNSSGHSPATSTNYSFRDEEGKCWVTRSGIDKSFINPTDFIEIDREGKVLPPYEHMTPSAETGIHCALYELFPNTQVVLHSHELYAVVLTQNLSEVHFEGYELQKAFPGVDTHQDKLTIPVIANSQDMKAIRNELVARKKALKYQVFMIEKHGFYTWAETLFEAKRTLEAFSYLCRAEWLIKQ